MFKVELKEGTSVFTSDGKEVGKINRFVLNPVTNQITDIVVQKGWLLTEDKVVPFKMVSSATEDTVELNEDIDNFEQLPPFEERHFVRAAEEDINATGYRTYRAAQAYYWYPPHGYMGYPAYGLGYTMWPPVETNRNIPENTVALKEGADVISCDKEQIGYVERLLVEPEINRTTHFVISQGLLFKDRKVVPANWVSFIEEDKVHLAVSSKLLEQLPSYEA